jgi:hypothetical protein
MKVKYKEYEIEMVNDSNYTLNSADNIMTYKYEYPTDFGNTDRYYPTSKHGIIIRKNEIEISSAIICETGGATGINKNSFVIKNDLIFICCSDKIYSLAIPNLTINWRKRYDPKTCFGIYKYENDFIVHGELEISRIDEEGNIKWTFGGRDIFATKESDNAFKIKGNKIELTDWSGYKYTLNSNGLEIENKSEKSNIWTKLKSLWS